MDSIYYMMRNGFHQVDLPCQGDLASRGEADRLYIEQLKLLHTKALLALVASTLTASVLSMVLWRYVDYQLVSGWFMSLVGAVLLQYRHIYKFHKIFESAQKARYWGRRFIGLTALTATIWGSTAIIFFPMLPLQHQIFVAILLGGMGAGAIAMYSPMFGAAVVFIFLALVPLIAQMFLQGSEPLIQMGWLSILFLLIITIVAHRMNKMTVRALKLGLDNKDLVEYLINSKARTEDLNRNLELEMAERKKMEARLRVERDFIAAVLDTEAAWVLVMDWDGSIARVNRICETGSGFSIAELKDRYIWNFLPSAEERSKLQSIIVGLAPGSPPVQHESRWVTRTGECIQIRWSITAMLNQDQSIAHIICTGIDQTAWKNAVWALDETREDFRALVEGVKNYAMYMLDSEGRIINWNAGTERLTGYGAEEVIGRHYSFLYAKEDGGDADDDLSGSRIEGNREHEGWHVRKDGSRFWATVVAAPLLNKEGKRRGFSVITGDITQRKQSEDTVRSLLQISADLNATLDIDALMDAVVRKSMTLIGAEGGFSGLNARGGLSCHRYIKQDRVYPFEYFFRAGKGVAGLVLLRRVPYIANNAANDPHVEPELREKLAIRAAIALPIMDYRGDVIGFFELHNKQDGSEFSRSDLEKLVAVSQAASLAIQNALAFWKIRRAEGLLTEETRVLEMVAKDAPLEMVLKLLISAVEEHCAGASCCLLFPDDATEKLQHVVAMNLPQDVCKLLLGVPMANFTASSGCEVVGDGTISLIDIDSDPVRTLWSSQIHNHDGKVLGIFAVLCRERRRPDSHELELVEKATHLAGIAVERKRAEEDLKLRNRAIDSSINAILIVESCGDRQPILYANPVVMNILGYSSSEIIGKDWLFWQQHSDQNAEFELLRSAIKELRDEHVIVRHARRDGAQAWTEIFVAPVRDDAQNRENFVVVMNDITDRMTADLEVKQSREQLRELSKHLQIVREEEKAQIAREIHDELGSTLTKLKMDISWLSKRIGGDSGTVKQMSSSMLGLVDSAISTTRRIATDLRPPILDDLGLCAAIEWQAKEFQKRMAIKCHLSMSADLEDLNSEYSIALFRIFQEAFTNIARHAQATDVEVTLRREKNTVVLMVKDNGSGIGVNARGRAGSHGVHGMYERAKSLGGSMTLEGEDGEGTTLVVKLPLPVGEVGVES